MPKTKSETTNESGSKAKKIHGKKQDLRERYRVALDRFTKAKEDLSDALKRLHAAGEYPGPPEGIRFRLPEERIGHTHSFRLMGPGKNVKAHINANTFDDGKLGEFFIHAGNREESQLITGLLDSLATAFSMALQYGAPAERMIAKFKFVKFEPSMIVGGSKISSATSLVDYIAQWLDLKFNK